MQIPISHRRPDDQSWQDYANCLGVDPDLFFPERGASTREAKEVCRGCVVREDCLEYALVNGEKFGIWGGMSERERRRLRRQRALARRAGAAQPDRVGEPRLDRAIGGRGRARASDRPGPRSSTAPGTSPTSSAPATVTPSGAAASATRS